MVHGSFHAKLRIVNMEKGGLFTCFHDGFYSYFHLKS